MKMCQHNVNVEMHVYRELHIEFVKERWRCRDTVVGADFENVWLHNFLPSFPLPFLLSPLSSPLFIPIPPPGYG